MTSFVRSEKLYKNVNHSYMYELNDMNTWISIVEVKNAIVV